MSSTTSSNSVDERSILCDALSDSYRRQLLRILDDAPGSMTLSDLAREIVRSSLSAPGQGVDDKRIERVRVSLYHQHVPKLAALNVVDYDETEQRVEIAESAPVAPTELLDE